LAITGGFRAETILSGIPAGETTITYRINATDKAGNVGQNDSDPTTATISEDHIVKVDTLPPSFATPIGAETGHAWNPVTKAIVDDPKKASKNSIRLQFNEDLDGTTIQTLDFQVAGAAPQSAQWFADVPNSVFLTVGTLLPDAKPKIDLVGPISDKAGNSVQVGTVSAATDGISPTVTVSVTPKLDKKKVTIDVSSDESLLTPPTIMVNGGATAVPTLVGTNLFRTTFETTDVPNAYNVEVSASDTAGNPQSSGKATHNADGAIVFEIDNSIPSPLTDPVAAGIVFTTNPFITVDWTSEGTEYGLDGSGALVPPAALPIAVDLDKQDMVTLTKATLDGTDVLARIATSDNRTFILSTSNLALGDHTFVVNGTDAAGNTLLADVSLIFTVKIRPLFEVALKPGWNMISLPGAPADDKIDTVIGAIPVDTVLTYDPSTPQGWLAAVRTSPTAPFSGTLTTVSLGRAYWVHTSSFESIKVDIPTTAPGAAVLLPAINVQKGWNLVPIVDITGTLKSGNNLAGTPNVYLQGLSVARIYEYNPVNQQFVNIDPAAGALKIGQGYWVYFNTVGVLVP
ncbi:MAG: hypothetical protein O3A47_06765, partial [Chloroflexi bacterium]|nr:hypothetical protein [Chloroflexota bacterium]